MTDRKYRMLQRCQVDGIWHDPGAVLTKPHDWKGPHRTIVGSQHGADLTGPMHHDRRHAPANIADHPAHMDNLVDVPLYEEVVEPDDHYADDELAAKSDWPVESNPSDL